MKVKPNNYIAIEFPSRSVNEGLARAAVAAFAAQLDPTLDELGDIKTAVSEAVTNAIVHAYPQEIGKIALRACIFDGNLLEITVRDWGCGIADVEKAREPLYTTGGEERSGMGFTIMESAHCALEKRQGYGRDDEAQDRAAHGAPMNAAPELLEAAAQGDEQACEQMLRENSGLIWSIVRRYYGRGVEPDDLYQLGCLGFIKAIKGFDFAFGTQFSTYAVPKIAGEIRRFLRDDGAIKVSRSMREQAATIFAAREKLKNTLGREPALSELSEETGFNAEEIAQCELAVAAPDSLQRETGDGLTLEGMLGGESPEDGLIERIALREAIDELPEREKMTILLRFFKGLTQEQAARLLGVSQVQVSRLERRALEKLRASLSDGL